MPPLALASSTASCMPLRPEIPRLALGPETSTITPRRMGGGGAGWSPQAPSSRPAVSASRLRHGALTHIVILAVADNRQVAGGLRVAEVVELDRPLQARVLALAQQRLLQGLVARQI